MPWRTTYQIAWVSSANAAATRTGGGFGGQFVVAAASVLHEPESGDDHLRSAVGAPPRIGRSRW
jgi:hypothetical protein